MSGAFLWSRPFGQSVFSSVSKATIDEYEKWVISYTKDLRLPMMPHTAAVNGVFVFDRRRAAVHGTRRHAGIC